MSFFANVLNVTFVTGAFVWLMASIYWATMKQNGHMRTDGVRDMWQGNTAYAGGIFATFNGALILLAAFQWYTKTGDNVKRLMIVCSAYCLVTVTLGLFATDDSVDFHRTTAFNGHSGEYSSQRTGALFGTAMLNGLATAVAASGGDQEGVYDHKFENKEHDDREMYANRYWANDRFFDGHVGDFYGHGGNFAKMYDQNGKARSGANIGDSKRHGARNHWNPKVRTRTTFADGTVDVSKFHSQYWADWYHHPWQQNWCWSRADGYYGANGNYPTTANNGYSCTLEDTDGDELDLSKTRMRYRGGMPKWAYYMQERPWQYYITTLLGVCTYVIAIIYSVFYDGKAGPYADDYDTQDDSI